MELEAIEVTDGEWIVDCGAIRGRDMDCMGPGNHLGGSGGWMTRDAAVQWARETVWTLARARLVVR